MADELKTTFSNWAMKIQTNFIQSPLLQPVGLELSCVDIIFETKNDYTFKGIGSEIPEDALPLAYYRPDTDSIHVFIEHSSFRKRDEAEKYAFLEFILFHEANHRLLSHIKRGQDKDPQLWNIAADFEVHNTLYVYYQIMLGNSMHQMNRVFQDMKNYISRWLFEKRDKEKSEGLFEKEYLQYIAEEIYNDLEKNKVTETREFNVDFEDSNTSDQSTAKVTVSTFKTKSGKKFTYTDIEFPQSCEKKFSEEEKQERENSAMTRSSMMENTLQRSFNETESGMQRGFDTGLCKRFLDHLFHVEIDWRKILRSSLATALDKSEDFSWAKPRVSLFALDNSYYLPSQVDDDIYGTIIIAQDESESMSDEDCRKAASIILEAKDYYKKIILLKHDIDIALVEEIEDIDESLKTKVLSRHLEGGTSHRAVFEWIRDWMKRSNEMVSCCIFITDMFSDISHWQDLVDPMIPRIWLCPKEIVDRKEYDLSIKGEVIGIK